MPLPAKAPRLSVSKMGRPRKDSKYPKYCYKHGNRWVYRPYLGKGKLGSPIYLCQHDAPVSAVWRAYERCITETTHNIRWLLDLYNGSPKVGRLAESTQVSYREMANIICRRETKERARFGDIALSTITRRTIQQYIDSYPHPISVNRQIQLLKAAWNWAMNRYDVPDNPCIGVELNKEKSRDRYIEDWEYSVVLMIALESNMKWLPVVIELAFLCRARRGEVLAYKRDDILPNGLRLIRSKKSRGEITKWTPRLRAAVYSAKEIHKAVISPWLLHNKHGEPLSSRTVESGWKRLMAKAVTEGAELPSAIVEEAREMGGIVIGHRVKLRNTFTYHDLKAKGLSDAQHHDAGHKSGAMLDVYLRKLREIEASG